mgnify:FL=1|jgi:adenylate cyclase class IV
MIEVEKKTQPTEEQLKALLEGAEFVKEKIINDIYYDLPDYSLFKKDIRLRKRGTSFELKGYLSSSDSNSTRVAKEIDNEIEIKKYLNLSGNDSLEEIIEKNFISLCKYTTKRREYKKEGFVIDVDETDFGYNMTEIELEVEEDEAKIKEAEEKLLIFAKKYDLEILDLPIKPDEYLRRLKPEVYKLVHEKNDEKSNEFKMK